MTSLTSKLDTHDASIKSIITTSRDTITNVINGVNNNVTQQGNTLKNAINTSGCVKSVQVIDFDIKEPGPTTVYISTVNVNKTILLIDTCSIASGMSFESTAKLTSNTSITIRSYGTPYDKDQIGPIHGTGIIQVVEFY